MPRPINGTTFWDRVYANTKQDGDCIIFTGAKDSFGYGRINGPKENRVRGPNGKWRHNLVRVHRSVWERDNGPAPAGMIIRHTCDRRDCINPKHLLLGTQADNIADMDERGRRVVLTGSEQAQAKLSEEAVGLIKERLAVGINAYKRVRELREEISAVLSLARSCSSAAIAKELGVSEAAIQNIKKGRRWAHVT